MNCNMICDLIPLYIDSCCSNESKEVVEAHIKDCPSCRAVFESMSADAEGVVVSEPPKKVGAVSVWRASVLQSALLFASFLLITFGVAQEASSPVGLLNGFWAFAVVIPATGFLLSLANWYFVRLYKSKKAFSACSCLATLVITAGAYIWGFFHYEISLGEIANIVGGITHVDDAIGLILWAVMLLGPAVVLTLLSKVLSAKYASLLGKE